MSYRTPSTRDPFVRVTHQALATTIKSPQGFKASPYLPSPECSMELNDTTASNNPNELSQNVRLYSDGTIVVICSC